MILHSFYLLCKTFASPRTLAKMAESANPKETVIIVNVNPDIKEETATKVRLGVFVISCFKNFLLGLVHLYSFPLDNNSPSFVRSVAA